VSFRRVIRECVCRVPRGITLLGSSAPNPNRPPHFAAPTRWAASHGSGTTPGMYARFCTVSLTRLIYRSASPASPSGSGLKPRDRASFLFKAIEADGGCRENRCAQCNASADEAWSAEPRWPSLKAASSPGNLLHVPNVNDLRGAHAACSRKVPRPFRAQPANDAR
jgi:hypothetical protein